jgi:hypothetical protein
MAMAACVYHATSAVACYHSLDEMLLCACRVNLQHMDPTGLLGMQVLQQDVKQPDGSDGQQTLVLCCSPSRKYFRGIATHVNNCIQVGTTRPWQAHLRS